MKKNISEMLHLLESGKILRVHDHFYLYIQRSEGREGIIPTTFNVKNAGAKYIVPAKSFPKFLYTEEKRNSSLIDAIKNLNANEVVDFTLTIDVNDLKLNETKKVLLEGKEIIEYYLRDIVVYDENGERIVFQTISMRALPTLNKWIAMRKIPTTPSIFSLTSQKESD